MEKWRDVEMKKVPCMLFVSRFAERSRSNRSNPETRSAVYVIPTKVRIHCTNKQYLILAFPLQWMPFCNGMTRTKSYSDEGRNPLCKQATTYSCLSFTVDAGLQRHDKDEKSFRRRSESIVQTSNTLFLAFT
jgi:hypothetical protein